MCKIRVKSYKMVHFPDASLKLTVTTRGSAFTLSSHLVVF